MMKSIFKGKKVKEVYQFGQDYGYIFSNHYSIKSDLKTISHETFLEINLSEPPLNKGDRFYNLETDETYCIEDAMRSTGDTMVYFTDKVLEKNIDEKSKQIAEEDKNKYEEEIRLRREQVEQENQSKEIKEKPKKSWWQKLISK